MPPRSERLRPPNSWVVSGQWPEAQLAGPPAATYTQALARALRDVMALKGLGIRETARICDLHHKTVGQILAGAVVPDVGTVAALEVGLDSDLWPRRGAIEV